VGGNIFYVRDLLRDLEQKVLATAGCNTESVFILAYADDIVLIGYA